MFCLVRVSGARHAVVYRRIFGIAGDGLESRAGAVFCQKLCFSGLFDSFRGASNRRDQAMEQGVVASREEMSSSGRFPVKEAGNGCYCVEDVETQGIDGGMRRGGGVIEAVAQESCSPFCTAAFH